MSPKERLERRLTNAREMTEGLLKTFRKPDEWVHQVHPRANHPLWFVGHMATTDNFFISLVAPDKVRDLAAYREKFGMGSQPSSNPADYPPVEDVLATMRERRQTLLEALRGLKDEDLDRQTPPGTPEFIPDVASIFEMAIWHEGFHAGQMSVARRALGAAPLFA